MPTIILAKMLMFKLTCSLIYVGVAYMSFKSRAGDTYIGNERNMVEMRKPNEKTYKELKIVLF